METRGRRGKLMSTTTRNLQKFARDLQGYATDCDTYGPPAPGMIVEYARQLLLIAIVAGHDVTVMDREIDRNIMDREIARKNPMYVETPGSENAV
jgi:hypothetical protein